MAKHKKKMPLFASAGFLAYGVGAYEGYKSGGWNSAIYDLTGYDTQNKHFNLGDAIVRVTPAVGGVVASTIASKFGLNRHVPAWLPFKF